MDKRSLQAATKSLPIPEIFFYEEVDSTNERALAMLADDMPEFTLLVAERQTAGRGRMGRKWSTTPGGSLAFSVVLHPQGEEIQNLGFFSLLGALAICLAIEQVCPLQPKVKWPNDVLLQEKKTAGILTETTFLGGHLAGVVVGLGINLLRASVPPPDMVMFPATCVSEFCPHLPQREAFLAMILEGLIAWRRRILSQDFMDAYRKRMAFIGQPVRLIPPAAGEIEGELLGVDERGQLVLKVKADEVQVFPVGDVKLREADQSWPASPMP